MFVEISIFLLLLAYLLYRSCRKPDYMPPGTFGLPVIGKVPSTTEPLINYLMDLKRKYGNIFTTKWGSKPIVCLTDHTLVRRIFSHPDIQGRLDSYSFDSFFSPGNYGLSNATDNVWKNNRRFMLHNLRNLGMGKTHLEDSIHNEVQLMISRFEDHYLNKPKEVELDLNISVLNVIWQMLAGQRYSADDPEILQYNKMTAENINIVQGPILICDFMPWLLKVVPNFLIKKLTGVDTLVRNREIFFDLCRKIIKQHKVKLDPENAVDIIDHYLLEIEENKNDPDTTFKADYHDLLVLMIDLFVAGSETTSNTIRWTLLYLVCYPEIQAKIHKLLDEVVPKDRLPSLQDRENLTYLEAVMLDVQRLSSLVPLSVPHVASSTVRFDNYVIPKDTIVLACTEVCHHDPAFWEKPNELYPEHFLDKNGKLNSKREGFLPFSLGRRQCVGEGLARMEIYLFLSAIMHKFVITAPPGETLEPKTDPSKILLNVPIPFKIVMKHRH